MRLAGKAVNLQQLDGELRAAGINLPALGTIRDGIHTYDEAGRIIELPEAARPVVDAHIAVFPPPEPTVAEKVAQAVAEAHPAVEAATTVAGIKAAMLGLLSGLGDALSGES